MKTVVITGSARGLGFEMAKLFRKVNHNVVISDLKEENLDNIIKDYNYGNGLKPYQLAEKYNLSLESTYEIYGVGFDSKVVWTFQDFGRYTTHSITSNLSLVIILMVQWS